MKYTALSLTLALCLFPMSAQAAPEKKLPENVDEVLEFADMNDDGVISRDEFLIVRFMMFERVDTDQSGGLTPQEFETALSERISRFANRAFKRVDTNKDGIVSADEWKAHPPVAFDKADANKDGILTPDERDAKRYR